jgi:hypothetical protein
VARRRRKSGLEVSLFPFLSVLAAVMGTLVLVISGMSQLSLADPDQTLDISSREGTDKIPRYVECQRDGLVIYPIDVGETRASKTRFVPLSSITDDSSGWSSFLAGLHTSKQYYLLLLVRPDGIDAFDKAYSSARTYKGLDIGYDPVHGKGKIRFRKRLETI